MAWAACDQHWMAYSSRPHKLVSQIPSPALACPPSLFTEILTACQGRKPHADVYITPAWTWRLSPTSIATDRCSSIESCSGKMLDLVLGMPACTHDDSDHIEEYVVSSPSCNII